MQKTSLETPARFAKAVVTPFTWKVAGAGSEVAIDLRATVQQVAAAVPAPVPPSGGPDNLLVRVPSRNFETVQEAIPGTATSIATLARVFYT